MGILLTRFTIFSIGLIALSLLFASTGSADHVLPELTEFLIGAWLFDDGEGALARDHSGNGNHGKLKNARWSEKGKFGGAVELTGPAAKSYVDLQKPLLSGLHEFTMVIWALKTTGEREEGLCGQHDAIEFAISRRNALNLRAFPKASAHGVHGDNPWCQQLGDDVCISAETLLGRQEGTDVEGNWTHFEATGDAKRMSSLKNGKGTFRRMDRGLGISWTFGVDTYGKSNNPATIGGSVSVPDDRYFTGLIDEVAFFSKGLTKDQLALIAEKGLEGTVLPVEPAGKLAVTWGKMKRIRQ